MDRYELLHPIARGGMGHVWAARLRGRRGFERIVAIKTALPELACDARVRAMFLDEARVASAIVHRNVAPVVDFLEWEGAQYLVMEWVEGASLKSLHDTRAEDGERVPIGVLLRVMADVCAGLHAAHELRDSSGALCGLVHRDVSPHNVLVSVEGVAKLIDFGVAKARSRATQETTFGALKGKPAFMAPEQARGEEVDRRADVWSVGATLYYMLAGYGPFGDGERCETLRFLVSGAQPLPLPRDVHPAVARLLSLCLAPRPQDRLATAEQLEWAIEDALEEMGVEASAKDVAAFTVECAGDEIAEQRAHVQVCVREPQPSISGVVVVEARRAVQKRWAMGGTTALSAAALAFALLHHEEPPVRDFAPGLTMAAPAPIVDRPSAPAAIETTNDVSTGSDSPAIIELTPVAEAAPRPGSARLHVPAAHAPRATPKARSPRPLVHASPPRTTDDFGSAVETRK